MKTFTNVIVAVPEESYDLAYAVLSDFPFLGIEERFDELLICFGENDWTPERKAELLAGFGNFGLSATILREESVKEENWNEEWEKSLEPIIINERIAIAPEWRKNDVTQPITLVITPKMSFGTGYHATTRMMCRLLEPLVEAGSTWIDAGTGTGVLAILAAKLGAATVLAFDNDEWSVENSLENVELNGVKETVEVLRADVFTLALPPASGIVANLYRNLLIPNFPRFLEALRASGGHLAVSGVLKYDVDEIVQAAISAGFTHLHTELEQEWAAILFRAPEA